MLVSVRGYGKYVVVPVFHTVTHVIHDTVIENVQLEYMVFVSSRTEQQFGKLVNGILEDFSYIIVEFVHQWANMHTADGFVELISAVLFLIGYECKVWDGARVVVFDGVRVQTDEFDPSGNKREVRFAENRPEGFFACTQTVVVTDEGNVRYFQSVQYVTLPEKLIGHSEVTQVSTMNDKIDIISLIQVIYKIYGFVIPALGVAHRNKTDSIFSQTVMLYLFDMVGVYIGFSIYPYIIRMIVYHVTAGQKQAGYTDTA